MTICRGNDQSTGNNMMSFFRQYEWCLLFYDEEIFDPVLILKKMGREIFPSICNDKDKLERAMGVEPTTFSLGS